VTDQTVSIMAEQGQLTTSGGRGGARPTDMPLGASRFLGPLGETVFSGSAGKRSFLLLRADGDTGHFEEVRPAPAAIKTADYVGEFVSDELDVHLEIAARDGKLFLRRRPADEMELRPSYVDDFQAQGLGSLRFMRDASGKVTGFGIFAGRVLDVRFRRASRS